MALDKKCPRDISTIIRTILCFVPLDREQFIYDLEKLYRDVAYRAPEEVHRNYQELANLVFFGIPVPAEGEYEPWQRAVLTVFSDCRFEDVKAEDARKPAPEPR